MSVAERTATAARPPRAFRRRLAAAGLPNRPTRTNAVTTTDRWPELPGGPVRAPWSTPVTGWALVEGSPRLTGAAAVWHLPDGDLTYGEMTLQSLELDVRLAPESSHLFSATRGRSAGGRVG